MSDEFEWRVMLVQELTKACKNPLPKSCDGHKVIADTPLGGVRVPAIILHEEMADLVVGKPILMNTVVAVDPAYTGEQHFLR